MSQKLLLPNADMKAQDATTLLSERRPSDAVERFSSGDTLRSSSSPSQGIAEKISLASGNSDFGATGRAVMIEFYEDGRTKQEALTSVSIMQQCLREGRSASAPPLRRLYLLEGARSDLADTLESHFKIESNFFQKYQHYTRSSLSLREGLGYRATKKAPLLPSLVDPQKTWCLKYNVLRSFEEEWESNWIRCVDNGRKIALSRVNGVVDKIGIIEQRASYWSRKGEHGNWDAIIVVDEPVKSVKIGGPGEDFQTCRQVRSQLYQGGYRNFVGSSSDQPPPLTSTFDDILHFCQHYSNTLSIGGDPLTSTVFLQKIVASNYVMLIKYVKSLLSHLSFRLSQRTNLGDLDSIWVENGWSDLQVWTWRCNKYCQRVEAIMSSLGIAEDDTQPAMDTICAKDFQGIHRQLLGLRQRSEMLVSDFNSVAAIVLNREALKEANRSIQEAKSVRVLTLLGMLFLPLGLASSLLSMTDDYSPGAEKFWIYFAIAIPLIVCVVVLAALVSLGYGGDQTWMARRYAKFRNRRKRFSSGSGEKV